MKPSLPRCLPFLVLTACLLSPARAMDVALSYDENLSVVRKSADRPTYFGPGPHSFILGPMDQIAFQTFHYVDPSGKSVLDLCLAKDPKSQGWAVHYSLKEGQLKDGELYRLFVEGEDTEGVRLVAISPGETVVPGETFEGRSGEDEYSASVVYSDHAVAESLSKSLIQEFFAKPGKLPYEFDLSRYRVESSLPSGGTYTRQELSLGWNRDSHLPLFQGTIQGPQAATLRLAASNGKELETPVTLALTGQDGKASVPFSLRAPVLDLGESSLEFSALQGSKRVAQGLVRLIVSGFEFPQNLSTAIPQCEFIYRLEDKQAKVLTQYRHLVRLDDRFGPYQLRPGAAWVRLLFSDDSPNGDLEPVDEQGEVFPSAGPGTFRVPSEAVSFTLRVKARYLGKSFVKVEGWFPSAHEVRSQFRAGWNGAGSFQDAEGTVSNTGSSPGDHRSTQYWDVTPASFTGPFQLRALAGKTELDLSHFNVGTFLRAGRKVSNQVLDPYAKFRAYIQTEGLRKDTWVRICPDTAPLLRPPTNPAYRPLGNAFRFYPALRREDFKGGEVASLSFELGDPDLDYDPFTGHGRVPAKAPPDRTFRRSIVADNLGLYQENASGARTLLISKAFPLSNYCNGKTSDLSGRFILLPGKNPVILSPGELLLVDQKQEEEDAGYLHGLYEGHEEPSEAERQGLFDEKGRWSIRIHLYSPLSNQAWIEAKVYSPRDPATPLAVLADGIDQDKPIPLFYCGDHFSYAGPTNAYFAALKPLTLQWDGSVKAQDGSKQGGNPGPYLVRVRSRDVLGLESTLEIKIEKPN